MCAIASNRMIEDVAPPLNLQLLLDWDFHRCSGGLLPNHSSLKPAPNRWVLRSVDVRLSVSGRVTLTIA